MVVTARGLWPAAAWDRALALRADPPIPCRVRAATLPGMETWHWIVGGAAVIVLIAVLPSLVRDIIRRERSMTEEERDQEWWDSQI
ncbi:hypothetical protein [Dongia sp.]|uniref:hypothetical protein n=1 Tax=Dongia sp. TaxID=1977262 RepID=UPI00374FE0BA